MYKIQKWFVIVMHFLKKQIENDWDISLDWRWAFEARQDSIWYARLHVICTFACDMQDCILYAKLHLICKITFDIQDCIWYARLQFICKIIIGKVLTMTTTLTPVIIKTFRILLTVKNFKNALSRTVLILQGTNS